MGMVLSTLTFSLSWGRERKTAEETHQVESGRDRGGVSYGLRWERRERVREVRRRERSRPSHVCQGRGGRRDE